MVQVTTPSPQPASTKTSSTTLATMANRLNWARSIREPSAEEEERRASVGARPSPELERSTSGDSRTHGAADPRRWSLPHLRSENRSAIARSVDAMQPCGLQEERP